MIKFLIELLTSLFGSVFTQVLNTPKDKGRQTFGNLPEMPATPMDKTFENAMKSGILVLLIILSLSSCATKEILIADQSPYREDIKGVPILAQDSVKVLIYGSDEVGTLEHAAGYVLIHKTDYRSQLLLIQSLQKQVEELNKKLGTR